METCVRSLPSAWACVTALVQGTSRHVATSHGAWYPRAPSAHFSRWAGPCIATPSVPSLRVVITSIIDKVFIRGVRVRIVVGNCSRGTSTQAMVWSALLSLAFLGGLVASQAQPRVTTVYISEVMSSNKDYYVEIDSSTPGTVTLALAPTQHDTHCPDTLEWSSTEYALTCIVCLCFRLYRVTQ